MATCPQCYTGTCRRHARQDHGRSQLRSATAEATLQKMYDQLVGAKLHKLQAEAETDPSAQRTRAFRRQLDAARDETLRKTRKSRPALASASGLNPQALAAVCAASDDEHDGKKRRHKHSRKRKHRSRSSSSSSDDSSDSSDDESRRRHRKRKHSHHKKSHKKKKHKRSRSDSE